MLVCDMPFNYETAVNLINVLSTLILSQALNDEVKAVQSGFYLVSPENLGNICSIIFFYHFCYFKNLCCELAVWSPFTLEGYLAQQR